MMSLLPMLLQLNGNQNGSQQNIGNLMGMLGGNNNNNMMNMFNMMNGMNNKSQPSTEPSMKDKIKQHDTNNGFNYTNNANQSPNNNKNNPSDIFTPEVMQLFNLMQNARKN